MNLQDLAKKQVNIKTFSVDDIKQTFARILAKENISVIESKIATAYFDITNRVLAVPVIDNIKENEDKIKAYLLHEIGHALFTPVRYIESVRAEKKYQSVYSKILNICEDNRIERMLASLYIGYPRTKKTAYAKLFKESAYANPSCFDDCTVIDKLNIMSKFPFADYNYTKDEWKLFNELNSIMEFSEIETLAKRILADMVKNLKTPKTDEELQKLLEELMKLLPEDSSLEALLENVDIEPLSAEEESEEESEGESPLKIKTQSIDDEKEEDEDSNEGGSADGEDTEEDSNKEDGNNISGDSAKDETDDDETDDDETDDDETDDDETNDSGSGWDIDETEEDKEESTSDKKRKEKKIEDLKDKIQELQEDKEKDLSDKIKDDIDKKLEDDIKKNTGYYYSRDSKNIIVEIIPKGDEENIVDFSRWQTEVIDDYKTQNEFHIEEFNRGNTQSNPYRTPLYISNDTFDKIDEDIKYLAFEFQRRKRGMISQKSKTSKSGELDLTKLHNYKFIDDIFKRSEVKAIGKNHGVFTLLDGSGSMCIHAYGVSTQIYAMAKFCNIVKIPFEIYMFQACFGSCWSHQEYSLVREISLKDDNTMLKNILSSRFKTDLRLASNLIYSAYSGRFHNPTCGQWSCTPEVVGIWKSIRVLENFKRRNNLDRVTFINITDGANSTSFATMDRPIMAFSEVDVEVRYNGVKTKGNNFKDIAYKIIKKMDITIIDLFLTISNRIRRIGHPAILYADTSINKDEVKKFKSNRAVDLTRIAKTVYSAIDTFVAVDTKIFGGREVSFDNNTDNIKETKKNVMEVLKNRKNSRPFLSILSDSII